MNDAREIAKLVEVSKMYYEENLTQAEIARRIDVSRPMVSKLLTRAKELGIVKIEIRSIFSSNDLLMGQMKNIFNIKGGRIVPQGNSEFITMQTVNNHAVQYITESLQECSNIGLGWGYTMGEVVQEIEKGESSDGFQGKVIPLIGTANIPNKSYHPNDLVRTFGKATGLEPYFMHAPAFPTTDEEKDIYMRTENFKVISGYWDELDMIVMAVGDYPSVPDQATAMRFGKKLRKERAVGKFLSYYFNRKGEIIKSEDDHVIHISLERMSACKKVVAVCTKTSPEAVLGALKTGFITHVIMDEKTAKDVMNLI